MAHMTVTDDFMAGLASTNAPLDRPTRYERARGGAALVVGLAVGRSVSCVGPVSMLPITGHNGRHIGGRVRPYGAAPDADQLPGEHLRGQ